MKLPSRDKCFKLMDKYGMYDNIKEHSVAVEKIGVYLARELKKNSVDVDEDLVSRSALLHDIAKVDEIKGRGRHDKIGEQILAKESYAELGKFCSRHYFGREKDLETLEEKILNYSDDRALGDKIVSLKERLEYIQKTYQLNFDYDEAFNDVLKIEKEIFSHLDFEPEKLNDLVSE